MPKPGGGRTSGRGASEASLGENEKQSGRREETGQGRRELDPESKLTNPRLVGVSLGPVRVSHQNAALSPRQHRALLAGRSHTRAACTRLSRGS